MKPVKTMLFLTLCFLLTVSVLPRTAAAAPGDYFWDFNDTANGALPAGFTAAVLDTGTYAWSVADRFPGNAGAAVAVLDGKPCAELSSYFSNSSIQANRWLITPQVVVPEDGVLQWKGQSIDYTALDSYNVLISTGGSNTAEFTPLLFVPNEPSDVSNRTYITHTLDLSGYAGQSVYIAFQLVSLNKYCLALDDIRICATHTVSASAGAGGTVSPAGETVVLSDANQAYAITPNGGYYVASVLIDGVEQGPVTSYTFSGVQADHTIAASFSNTPVYGVTASAGSGGTVSPSGVTCVSRGGAETYTITPSAGYRVSSVLVDGAEQGCVLSYTFTDVQANHTISASFERVFTLTASAGVGGTVSPDGETAVAVGGTQTYTITPNAGYRVSSILVDGAEQGSVVSYTFTDVQANHTISASFERVFTLTASAGANGTIAPDGETAVIAGGTQTYTITPNAGYRVSFVLVDGTEQGSVESYTFTDVQADHTIAASFVRVFTLTASAGANGTISPDGETAVIAGGTQTYTITPNAGYRVSSVLVDGTEQGSVESYTFTDVQANHTISASFTAIDRTSGPDYIARGLSDTSSGVSVSGSSIHRSASLRVRPLAMDTLPAAMRDALSGSNLLLGYDISVSRGFRGAVELSFPVGMAYEGQTVTILHAVDGSVETYTAVVTGGMATVTVTTLSPFAVLSSGIAAPAYVVSDPPKTGDAGNAAGLALALSALVLAAALRKRNARL